MNQTIGVNITPQSFQPTLHFSQGDVGRVFVVNVTDYDIPSGATVTCVATKPSGMGFTVSGTVSGNQITFTSTAEMTDEWGRFPAEIRIASGDVLLGTANFLMIGEKDPHPASTIDGTQEELIPQLTLLVNRVEAAAESVHDLTVSATTLAAGSDATATYDSTNNSIAFGIPRGADGDVTRSEFSDLKSDILKTNEIIESGFLQLDSSDFESGSYKLFDGTNEDNPRAVRCKNSYSIHIGDKLITEASPLYMGWYLLDSLGNLVETGFLYTNYRVEIKKEAHTFSHDGTLYLTVANGYNWGNSSEILPSDMTATIRLVSSYAAREIAAIKEVVENLEDDCELIYSKRISETVSASESKYFYFPLSFLKDHNYVVKIKFSAFVSTNHRKYSLRTTTYTSVSSEYLVQMIGIVDGVNPTIGQEYIYRFKATSREGGEIGKYLALELSVTGSTECIVEVYSVKAEDALPNLNAFSDIVTLNHGVPNLIRQGTNPFNRSSIVPLSLLHFSDIHGNQDNLSRMVEMKESLASLLDDTICTGDMVVNNYSATCMDFWDAVDGAEDILLCLGNHDLADGEHGYSSDQIGQTVAYQKYFSPYISNWGVTSAGTNLTYWYKDYASKKVRVIALNYLLTGDEQTAQNTWLASRLAEAKTNSYAVVILEHTPLNSFTKVNCNFSIIGMNWGYSEFPTIYQDTVQSFIDGGGEFACYLAGHCHCDYVGYNSNYPDQLCIAITTAQTTRLDNDQRRAVGEKSQDAGNIVLVDTVTKTVKLIRVGADMDCYLRGRNLFSINYSTKTVIADS